MRLDNLRSLLLSLLSRAMPLLLGGYLFCLLLDWFASIYLPASFHSILRQSQADRVQMLLLQSLDMSTEASRSNKAVPSGEQGGPAGGSTWQGTGHQASPSRGRRRKRNEREREEIWREKEEELASPPFFLSSLLPLSPPSVWLPPLSFFSGF